MTPNTFNVRFVTRSNRADKYGNVPIYAKVTINGEATRFSVNHKVKPDNWLTDKNKQSLIPKTF